MLLLKKKTQEEEEEEEEEEESFARFSMHLLIAIQRACVLITKLDWGLQLPRETAPQKILCLNCQLELE